MPREASSALGGLEVSDPHGRPRNRFRAERSARKERGNGGAARVLSRRRRPASRP